MCDLLCFLFLVEPSQLPQPGQELAATQRSVTAVQKERDVERNWVKPLDECIAHFSQVYLIVSSSFDIWLVVDFHIPINGLVYVFFLKRKPQPISWGKGVFTPGFRWSDVPLNPVICTDLDDWITDFSQFSQVIHQSKVIHSCHLK
jgi:hypothetical protein